MLSLTGVFNSCCCRVKINELEKQKEDRWPIDEGEPEEPNEQTELRLLRRTIVLAFEELEALVPEMLTDDDRKTLALSRKLAAVRQAEHDAERAEVAAALIALKKWFPDCELDEDTATMNQVTEVVVVVVVVIEPVVRCWRRRKRPSCPGTLQKMFN